MRPRTLFILSFLVLALGAFVWFFERDLPSSEERSERAKKVLRIEADEVDALVLEAGESRVRLERERTQAAAGEEGEKPPPSQRWRLTEPLEAAADGSAVSRLLGSLTGLEKQRTLDEADRSQVGLEPPRAVVTLRHGERETVLEVGSSLPSSDSTLAALRGRPEVYVVGGGFVADLMRAAGDWRDKNLFPGERADIQSVRLRPAGGGEVLLARRGEAFWLESPLADRADADEVTALLSALAGLQATRFVDADSLPAGDLGLEPPALGSLEVVLAGREEAFRVAVGSPAAEGSASRYLAAGAQQVESGADLGRYLAKAAEDWRSLALIGLDSWQVDQARFEDAEGTLELAREGGAWQRDGEEIPFTPVSDLLAALTDARAAGFAAGVPAGEPVLEARLGDGEERAEVLSFHAAPEGGALVTVEGREGALTLGAEELGEIQAKLLAVRLAEPVPAAAEEPAEDLEIESEEGGGI